MNKLILLAAAVPVLCTGAGFGAGVLLAPAPATATSEAEAEHGTSEAPHDAILSGAEAAHAKDDHASPETSHGAADSHASKPAEPSGHGADMAEGSHTAKQAAKTVVTRDGEHELVAAAAHDMAKPEEFKRSSDVVKLGQITVPVYKPMSVTYVVADLGIAMPDTKTAAHYRVAENAVHLRDTIVASFRKAAENPKMKRATLDSDWLSKTLTDDLRAEVKEVQEVLFLTLYKKDVPRS